MVSGRGSRSSLMTLHGLGQPSMGRPPPPVRAHVTKASVVTEKRSSFQASIPLIGFKLDLPPALRKNQDNVGAFYGA